MPNLLLPAGLLRVEIASDGRAAEAAQAPITENMENTMITPEQGGTTVVTQNYNINPGYAFDAATMTPAQVEEAITAFKDFTSKLPPLVSLTPLQRQRTARIGIRTRGFIELVLEAAKKDPTILPGNIPLEKFLSQAELLNGISLIQTFVADYKRSLDDAAVLIGAKVYGMARTGYAVLKTPAGQAKLQEQVELMKQRFVPKAKRSQSTNEETEEVLV